jgi:hypothetical protein
LKINEAAGVSPGMLKFIKGRKEDSAILRSLCIFAMLFHKKPEKPGYLNK